MRIFRFLSCVFIGFILCSCAGQKDDSAVTMLVIKGFGEQHMTELAENVKRDLGIDIEFIYESSSSTNSQVEQHFIHNDLNADIIFTAARVQDSYLKNCCLNLFTDSDLVSKFPMWKVKEMMTPDGAVYQLPLSSKLIGITYNKTLLEEKGWKVPRTFNDMLDLKSKCDAEEIPFAFTDIRSTSAPFNCLFNLMGAQWLNSVKGSVWLEGFLEGTKSVNVFKAQARYFRKWTESGLFGEFACGDALEQFSKRRALFCYSILNDSNGYSGPQYDEAGRKTGVMLEDVHKAMPWISEFGTDNCFTVYDNCIVMVNGALAAENKSDKRAKVLSVLEYMLSEESLKSVLELAKDAYFPIFENEFGEDRTYSEFRDDVKKGFVQPWYYDLFTNSNIIHTGAELGSYMINACVASNKKVGLVKKINYDFNPDATFDSAIYMLRNTLHSQEEEYLGWASEDIEAPELARMAAIAGGLSLQEQLKNEEVCVALMPYAAKLGDIQPWRKVPVMNAKAYQGALNAEYPLILTPMQCQDVAGIRMTGARIQEIVSGMYDPSDCYDYDSGRYGPYPYACVTKYGRKLEPDVEYLVAVVPATLRKDVYDAFVADGKVVPVTASLTHGISLYFSLHPTINNSEIDW